MSYDPRELEWQRRYDANDTPWDKGAAAPPLIDFLREGRMHGRVLIPGCGRGHDVRAVAGQPETSVVGLDVAETAVAQARSQTPGTMDNVSFLCDDFFHLPAELRHSFDWVVEHTCFCAIDPRHREAYATACADALRVGGRIFGIFFLNPDRGIAPPFPVDRAELDALFGSRFSLIEEWVPPRSFEGRENRELVRLLEKRPEP